jgi:ribose/xylose/arabinose/galactoside ABC-type transport system permease subunit
MSTARAHMGDATVGRTGGRALVPRPVKGLFQSRFGAVWIALAVLVVVTLLIAPATFSENSLSTVTPLAAILAVAAFGQTLVVMTGGIDLSIPAVITMVGIVLLKVSGGTDDNLVLAIVLVLVLPALIGLVNGVLVTLFGLNALVVTLAVGQLVLGVTLWYRGALLAESEVPPALAEWAGEKVYVFSEFVFVALALLVLLSVALHRTPVGRRFVAAGANPTAAAVAGVPVRRYQIGAYVLAGLFYGLAGLLLASFVRSPGEDLGSPYLLATVVVVVLGGASLAGGPASFVATAGGVVFIALLNQLLRVKGLSTGWQVLTQGVVLALGMAFLAGIEFARTPANLLRRAGRLLRRGPGARPPAAGDDDMNDGAGATSAESHHARAAPSQPVPAGSQEGGGT